MEHSQITVVFTSELTQALSEHRLPPAYVGVRRVRPSATVTAAFQSQAKPVRKTVVYTIQDAETGVERRMTRQEKKELKLKIKQEEQVEKKQRKLELQQQQLLEAEKATTTETSKKRKRVTVPDFLLGDQYYNLPINVAALEQELADLAGERNRVPPVAIAPPMTRLVLGTAPLAVVVDDDLAQSWATALKVSMQAAECVRQAEDMRALVYDVVPSVWSRMRPESMGSCNCGSSFCLKEGDAYDTFPVRDVSSPADMDRAAVIQALHVGTNLHISCGAKFGGDYLIYEAPRDECHAFAGLRVLSKNNKNGLYPIPTAYDMTGYVRCLHTAAKLALLAMVQERSNAEDGTSVYHVAFVELALIKIGSTSRR